MRPSLVRLVLGGFLAAILGVGASAQDARVRVASELAMPRAVDSSSPAFWRDGKLMWYGSQGGPWLSSGADLFGPWETRAVPIESSEAMPRWLESVWPDDGDVLYGWYHAEPIGLVPDSTLTAPRMGAVVSTDGGATLRDLGVVLESGDPLDPSARNGYFAGGHGDGTVIHDRSREWFYFFFGNYGGAPESQGVCVARMAYEDRADPAGKVWKYFNGSWREAGRGGRVTPIFPVRRAWQSAAPDAFWGPSVHWNTYLNCFVMLLNHAAGEPGWAQEGIYVSFCADLSKPETWTTPRKILDKSEFPGWYFFYPQVMGLEAGASDRRAGQVARLYVGGVSRWEIEFVAPAIPPTALEVAVSPSATVPAGAPVMLSVSAMGQIPFTYQWLRNGAAIAQATGATLALASAATTDTGIYSVIVSNGLGSTTSGGVALTVSATPPVEPLRLPAFLSNLSVYARVAEIPAALTLGYSVRASEPKPLVVRAIGPALASLGVTGGAANPRLALFDASANRIAENEDWRAADAEKFEAAGAFALPAGSADAALATAVPPGTGTARAQTTGAGLMLLELYDPAPAVGAKVDNISARAHLDAGGPPLVGGFTVRGAGTMRVLIRALGPRLAAFGVTEALADPVLEVFDENGVRLAQNDDWEPALEAFFRVAGASLLAPDSRDAAVVVTVPAGRSRSLAVRSADGSAGEVLLEIYELP